MINDDNDTNDRDQVTIEIPVPKNATIEIPIQNEIIHGSADGYPQQSPPSAPLLSSPINNQNDHYDIIASPTRVTTTKTIDSTKTSKVVSTKCSLWLLLFAVLIVSGMVFLLVFGWPEKFSIGEISVFGASELNGTEIGQGNLTMDYLKSDMANTNTPDTKLLLTVSSNSITLTSTSPPTQTPDTQLTTRLNLTNLTYPFGWREPKNSFTAEKQVQLLSPTATTVFEEMDKNVFGNMSIFLTDKNRFVVSPFLLNYILSFIGKFGDDSTTAVIKDKYFGVNDVDQIYNYYINLQKSFSSAEEPCFILNSFISGDNPARTDNPYKRYNFMEEIIEKDGIPFYPSSDRSYETYYNDRIRKNSFDKSRREFFVNKELRTAAKKVVGFSHLQKSLKFKNVTNMKIVDHKFNGLDKQYTVDMFVNDGRFEDFEEHRLYKIPFSDEKYTFFILHNRYNSSIPNITVSDILKSVKNEKSNTAENQSAICIPEISQQNTYDFSRFINLSVGKELSFMFDQPFGNQILDKYFQAIRFDLRAEGVNIKEREHKYGKFKCEMVDRTFIYGVFYNDMTGHEALLYYGLFI